MKMLPRLPICLAIFSLAGFAAASAPAKEPASAATAPGGWKLTWSDEFDGPQIDAKKWDFDIGNGFKTPDGQYVGGWGNGELEHYTDRPENAFIKDGMLHIRAIKENFKGQHYTSARLKSRKNDRSPLFNQTYGRFDFRAKLPTGQGVWPAIWMLPQEEKYGGWAASGEIDIMEAKGQRPNIVQGTLHFGSHWPANTWVKREYTLPDNGRIDEFHVYSLEWEPGEIRWLVDDKQYAMQNFWWSSSAQKDGKGSSPKNAADLNPWPAPFDHSFYIVMNVAVGGQFLGNPDKTTQFPVEMVVDYVRAYEKIDGYKLKPRGEGKLPFNK